MPAVPTAYTKPELDMFQIISAFKVPFLTQEPVYVSYVDDEGEVREYEYVPDFLIMRKLIIEVDGERWHTRGKQPFKDARRDEALKKKGLKTLRFTDVDLEERFEWCTTKIRLAVRELLNMEFAKKRN